MEFKNYCSVCGRELNGLFSYYQKIWKCSDCTTDKNDILHAEIGCKCKVSSFSVGTDIERQEAKRLLSFDKIYTVKTVVVGGWYSTVELKEAPNVKFNSVFFERVRGTPVEYKGFQVIVEYVKEDKIFSGKVLSNGDLILFEGKTEKEAIKDFREAIDDYIAICEELEKENNQCKSK